MFSVPLWPVERPRMTNAPCASLLISAVAPLLIVRNWLSAFAGGLTKSGFQLVGTLKSAVPVASQVNAGVGATALAVPAPAAMIAPTAAAEAAIGIPCRRERT